MKNSTEKLSYNEFNKQCRDYKDCRKCPICFMCDNLNMGMGKGTLVEDIERIIESNRYNAYEKALLKYIVKGIKNKKIFKED